MRGQQGAPSAPALDHGCPRNGRKSRAVSLIVIMLLFVEVEVLYLFGDGWVNVVHNLINKCCVILFPFFFGIFVRALFNFVFTFVFMFVFVFVFRVCVQLIIVLHGFANLTVIITC